MLKAIHAQESKEAARKKACDVAEKLRSMRLNEAAKKVEDGIEETLTYMEFPVTALAQNPDKQCHRTHEP